MTIQIGTDPLEGRHPAVRDIMRHFENDHLPPRLQAVSAPSAAHAWAMVRALPDCAELTAGLRKLLESKDCFVRAALDQPEAVNEREPLPEDTDQGGAVDGGPDPETIP